MHAERWGEMARLGQDARLAAEVQQWRDQALQSLQVWLQGEGATSEARKALESLRSLPTWSPELSWEEYLQCLHTVQSALELERHVYLQNLGPTQNARVNYIVLLIERAPNSAASSARSILREASQVEVWTGGKDAASKRALSQCLQTVGWELMDGGDPAELREEVLSAWNAFEGSEAAAVLASPTRSPRWNSWIALLSEVEAGRESLEDLAASTDELDADLEELDDTASEALQGCLQDYREASSQLRLALQHGHRPKGFSQFLPSLLVEVDSLLIELEGGPGPSKVRQLCQQFEESQISTLHFHQGLEELGSTLREGRRQAHLQEGLRENEEQFLLALGQLEEGLEILRGVERPSQGTQLQMGCLKIEAGLTELSALQNSVIP